MIVVSVAPAPDYTPLVQGVRRGRDSRGTPQGSRGTPQGSRDTPQGSRGTIRGDMHTIRSLSPLFCRVRRGRGSRGTPQGSRGTPQGDRGTIRPLAPAHNTSPEQVPIVWGGPKLGGPGGVQAGSGSGSRTGGVGKGPAADGADGTAKGRASTDDAEVFHIPQRGGQAWV